MKDFRLGPWLVQPDINTLSRDGRSARVEPQVMEVLAYLASRQGEVVGKEELISEVWEGRFVGDEVIANSIWELRRALGDDARKPAFIQTIPKRGYRLIAAVEPAQEKAARNSGRRRIGYAAAALVVLALLTALPFLSESPELALQSDADSPSRLSIAVLPLRDVTEDAEAYFAEGLSESLAGELARMPQFRVIASSSMLPYRDTRKPLAQIARELDVRALVEGTVERSAGRVLLDVRLSDPETRSYVWSGTFQRDAAHVAVLSRHAARSIALEAFRAFPVDGGEQAAREVRDELGKLASQQAIGREAYENYLKGRYFWKKRTEPALRRAVSYFEEAIRLEPSYAAAHAGLADAHIILGDHLFVPMRESLEKARAAADRALELDPASPEALTARAWVAWTLEWDWQTAEELFRRALRINPNYATGHQWFAGLLQAADRFEEAAFHSGQAQRLDLLSPIVHTTAGALAHERGLTAAARKAYEKALEIDPDFMDGHGGLMFVGVDLKDLRLAQPHCRWLAQTVRARNDWRPHIFMLHVEEPCSRDRLLGGKELTDDDFGRLLSGLRRQSRRGFVSPFAFLKLHSAARHPQEAARWLGRAIEERGRHVFYLSKHFLDEKDIRALDDARVLDQLARIPQPPES